MYFYTVLKKYTDFIIYSNIWIAIGSVSLCLESWLLHDHEINLWYLCFLFCGTSIIYNLHRIIGIILFIKNKISSRHNKVLQYKSSIIVLLTFCTILGVYSFLQILDLISIWLIITAIASIFYVTPFYRYNRLRDFPLIKIFLIAICWSILCYTIPVKHFEWSLFAERVLFMIAITIPFDIRDEETDSVSNTLTLVSWLGVERAKYLAIILSIAGYILLSSFALTIGLNNATIIFYLAFYLLTCALIYRSSINKPDYYFSGYIDGLLILRVLIIGGALIV